MTESTIAVPVTFDEWTSHTNTDLQTPARGIITIPDTQAAHYLKDCFTGFMLVPVSIFKGHAIEAKSYTIKGTVADLETAKATLLAENNTSPIFLYKIDYCVSTLQAYGINVDTGIIGIIDPPLMVAPIWKIRYATMKH